MEKRSVGTPERDIWDDNHSQKAVPYKIVLTKPKFIASLVERDERTHCLMRKPGLPGLS